jgi:hypothetical protein
MSETFRFAPMRDMFGQVFTPASVTLDDTPAPKPVKPEADKPFVFAPGLARKAASVDHHDDKDCHCGGACSSCSAEYLKFVKSARPATKLEVGSRVRCTSCPGQPGKKVMVVRELTATEKGYLLSVDYEDGSGSMHGIFDHDELVAA